MNIYLWGVWSWVRHQIVLKHRGFYKIIVKVQEQRPSICKDFIADTVKETQAQSWLLLIGNTDACCGSSD